MSKAAPLPAFQGIAAAPPACAVLASPPAELVTQSKYDQDSAGHDLIDDDAQVSRHASLADAQRGVRQMQALVMAPASGAPIAYRCARSYIVQWARAASLSAPQSDDVERTLARLTADISVVALRLEAAGELEGTDRSVVESWLQDLAQSVRHYFDDDAGPVTSNNNHRYWAAFALAAVGKVTGRNDDLVWAASSYALGVCQVTSDGILPLELARQTQARNYHLYAYQALRGVELLLPDETSRVASQCPDGLERLTSTVSRADAGSFFETLTGVTQAAATSSPDPVLLLL